LINPDAFLTVAEEAGLLVGIDQWVLGQAAEQAAEWRREVIGPAFGGIAVNITGRHLAEARLAEILRAALADHGLAAGSLSIEVNERVLMDASISAMNALRTIRSLGVGVGLDDFLTGYSSVAHLRRFPLDFVKIDQSFVSELAPETKEVAVVAAVVDLAHALGLSVVAEGIETADQLSILRGLGCDHGQGFVFGLPADAATLTSLVQHRASWTDDESMAS
jgi:EAL domain-containing protein (putative c-di-GMP-specific phosphodiesterase class I)